MDGVATLPCMPDERPILAVDVDGVISLFGFESIEDAPGRFELLDGVPHCISPHAGARLNRLAEHYELIWATGWEERANYHLPQILGLPEELPCLTFDGRAAFGSAHWKLDAIADFAGERPLAWIDDNLDLELLRLGGRPAGADAARADRVTARNRGGARRGADSLGRGRLPTALKTLFGSRNQG